MDNNVFLQRAGRIAGVGGWRVDLPDLKVTWSIKTCEILEYPENYQPTLEEAISLYTPESKPIITDLVDRAISDGTPYDVELSVWTRSGALKWVRSVGEVEYSNGIPVALTGAFQDVTDRKRAETLIAQSLEETKAYYDNAPCGYYSLGPDRTILRANDRLLEWFGCSREDVIGIRKPTDFMTAISLEPAKKAFKHLLENGEVNGLECELLPVNGTSRHVSISAKAHFDKSGAFLYSSSVMFDVTDMVHQRTRADRLSSDLFSMIDNDLVGTIIVRERKIVWANRAMHRMLGYEEGELVGLPTRTGYKDEETYERIAKEAYPLLQTGVAYKSEVEMAQKDGRPLWVHIHGMRLQNRDGDSMWMMSDVSELKQINADAHFLAIHDSLTGLPNRRSMNMVSRSILDAAARDGLKVAFCFLDLDGFKTANDRFGHDVGDHILKTVGDRLRKCLRKNDQLFRFGGDEFAIILNDVNNITEVDAVLDRVLKELRAPIHVNDAAKPEVSGSIGVSFFPDDSIDCAELIRQADIAMYEAKRNGKNTLAYYSLI